MSKTVMCDANGDPLIEFNGLYWSRNFDRFWQLIQERDAKPVMVCRLYPGMNPRFVFYKRQMSRLNWWNKWCHYGWAFFDPECQNVFPRVTVE